MGSPFSGANARPIVRQRADVRCGDYTVVVSNTLGSSLVPRAALALPPAVRFAPQIGGAETTRVSIVESYGDRLALTAGHGTVSPTAKIRRVGILVQAAGARRRTNTLPTGRFWDGPGNINDYEIT